MMRLLSSWPSRYELSCFNHQQEPAEVARPAKVVLRAPLSGALPLPALALASPCTFLDYMVIQALFPLPETY